MKLKGELTEPVQLVSVWMNARVSELEVKASTGQQRRLAQMNKQITDVGRELDQAELKKEAPNRYVLYRNNEPVGNITLELLG